MAKMAANGMKDLLSENGTVFEFCKKMKESRLYLIVMCFVVIYYYWSAVVSFCCQPTTAGCDYSKTRPSTEISTKMHLLEVSTMTHVVKNQIK